MAARGVHFAITDEQRSLLPACDDDDQRIDCVREHIEQAWEEEFLQETDKAWDAIHRCLSDFPPDTPWFYPVDPSLGPYALPEDHGTLPLKLCVLGGRRLITHEEQYFIRLVEPSEVLDLSPALQAIDKTWMSDKYFIHCKGAWPEYGEEDFEYTWKWFESLREFYARMAGNGRSVIFTADQNDFNDRKSPYGPFPKDHHPSARKGL